MDMLPPEQMAFLIPNLLGMLEALFIIWVILTVEKWRGKKEVRKLAGAVIAPAIPEENREMIETLTDEGMALLDAEFGRTWADQRAHTKRMREIIAAHQKPSPVEE